MKSYLGSKITWNGPIVTGPTAGTMTLFGCITRPPEHLMYAPAVELCYLGEMGELDQLELVLTNSQCSSWNWC